MDLFTLNTTGFFFTEIAGEWNVLGADYGDGFKVGATVGHPAGTRAWSMKVDVLPGEAVHGGFIPDDVDESLTLTEAGQSTRAEYLWRFFRASKENGNRPFWIEVEDPEDGDRKLFLASFVDNRLSYEMLRAKIYSTGLALEQRRLRDVASPVLAFPDISDLIFRLDARALPAVPQTTIASDFFSRADSASVIGTTPTGSKAWATHAGTMGISGGKLYASALASSEAVATIDTGLADGFFQTSLIWVSGGEVALIFRALDEDNYLYFRLTNGFFSAGKMVAGVDTGYSGALATPTPNGVLLTLTARSAGNGIDYIVNGARVFRVTLSGGDQAIFGARTRAGIRLVSTAARVSSFAALEGGVIDGSGVVDWPNSVAGAAGTAIQTNAEWAPQYVANDGDPFVKFINGGSGLDNMVLTLPTTSNGKYTMLVVARKTTPADTDPGFIMSLPNFSDFAIGFNQGMVASSRNSVAFPTGIAPSSGFDLLTWVFDPASSARGSGVRAIANGRESFRNQNVNSGVWNGATWSTGWLGTGNGQANYPFLGDLKALLIFNRVLTASELTLITDYLRERYLSTVPELEPEQTFVFEGDSLTAGLVGNVFADAKTFSEVVLLAQANRTRAYNFGVSGQTCTQMAADAATQVDPFFDAGHDRNVLVVWGGTNDMTLVASNPTAPFNALKSYCLARRAVGWKVVVLTCLPRGTAGQFETDRQAFNAAILGDASFYDALADVGTNATIGEPGDQNNTTYYFGDKIHLTKAGHAIVAPMVAAAIDSLP
jgi:lysophospholipase L1-like esterase